MSLKYRSATGAERVISGLTPGGDIEYGAVATRSGTISGITIAANNNTSSDNKKNVTEKNAEEGYSTKIKEEQYQEENTEKISETEKNSKVKNVEQNAPILDKIYTNEAVRNYKDIRLLDEDYNIEKVRQEKKGNSILGFTAVVLTDYEKELNADLYRDFIENYKKKKSAFLRVAHSTVEGDLILYDIFYDGEEDVFFAVRDDTRDMYGTDLSITVKKYKYASEYSYHKGLYWVLYNKKLNKNTFEKGKTFEVMEITEWKEAEG